MPKTTKCPFWSTIFKTATLFILLLIIPKTSHAQSTPSCFNLDVGWASATTVGETVCVPIRARSFGDLVGIQYTFVYDETVLAYDSHSSGAITVTNANFNSTVAGQLPFAWIENTLIAPDIPDNAVLFSVCFEVLDISPDEATLQITNSPTVIEFVRENASTLESYGIFQGGVQLSNLDPYPEGEACILPIGCNGSASGEITFDLTSGDAVSYAWFGPNGYANTTKDITGLDTEGDYTLQFTDGNNGQQRDAFFHLANFDDISFSLNVINDQCGGAPSGSITVAPSIGNANFEYQWSNGATDATISNLSAGNYSVTITNASTGCEYYQSAEVIELSELSVSVDIIAEACANAENGAIDLTINPNSGEGPYQYVWSTGAATQDISNLGTGTYFVTVNSNDGCVFEDTFFVPLSDGPAITATIEDASCVSSNGSITLTSPQPSDDYSYTWSNGATTANLIDIPAGTYSVTVTDVNEGCTNEASFTVNNTDLVAAWTYDCVYLNGEPFSSKISAILWNPSSFPVTYSFSSGDEIITNEFEVATINAFIGESYAVTITDGDGCSTVIEDMQSECNDPPYSPNACFGLDLSSATGSVGENVCIDVSARSFGAVIGMQYTHDFDPDELAYTGATSGAIFVSGANFALPEPGKLTFAWTEPTLSAQDYPDGTIMYSICFDILQDNNTDDLIQITGNPTPIELVTVDENDNILSNYSFGSGQISTVVQEDGPTITEACIESVGCNGSTTGSIDISLEDAGSYSFSWTGPNGFTASTEDLNDLADSGVYSLEVEDGDGNSRYYSFNIETVEAILTITASIENATCGTTDLGSLSPTVSGGSGSYSYSWSNGATTQDIADLDSGVYFVTVTDMVSGCTGEASFIVDEVTALEIDVVVTPEECDGANNGMVDLTITAPNDYYPLTYNWTTGDQTEDIVSGAIGSITVTVAGQNGCSEVFEVSVPLANGLIENSQVENPWCGSSNNGSINLEMVRADQNYDFAWSNGATTQNLDDLSAGTYAVTITNPTSGCEEIASFTLEDQDHVLAYATDCIGDGTTALFRVINWINTDYPHTYTYSDGTQDEVSEEEGLSEVVLNADQSYSVTMTTNAGCTVVLEDLTADCGNLNTVLLEVTPSDQTVEVGDNFCVAIQASNFNNITGAQFSLDWNPDLLSYTGTQNIELPTTTDITNQTAEDVANGQLRFQWFFNDIVNGHSVADNSTLFEVCFEATSLGVSPVNITNDPVLLEVTDNTPQALPVATGNALVTIGNTTGSDDLILRIGTAAVEANETACIDVIADAFLGVNAMQTSIRWDNSVLDYITVANFGLPGLLNNNFGVNFVDDGILTFSWFDAELDGTSLPPSTVLFSICFDPLVDEGASPVYFSDTPTAIEIVDIQDNEVIPTLINGQVAISDNFVWPGDTDLNGTVNHFDLLQIGLGFGLTGSSRVQGNIDWYAQYAAPWLTNTPSTEINYRNADTDGNGVILATDVAALEQNWDEVTNFWSPSAEELRPLPFFQTEADVPLYVESQTVSLGEAAEFKVILGDEEAGAEGIYGIAFSINYDPVAIIPSSVSAGFTESWIGELGDNLLAVSRNYEDEHRLDIAITRTDGMNIDGLGQIATMYVVLEDVIFRDEDYVLEFSIDNIRIINAAEQAIGFVAPITQSTVVITDINDPEFALEQIEIFPVPTTDDLYIRAAGLDIERVDLLDINGRFIRSYAQPNQISVADLAAGSYYLRLFTDVGLTSRRFIKQ